jgi:O-antigen ligase
MAMRKEKLLTLVGLTVITSLFFAQLFLNFPIFITFAFLFGTCFLLISLANVEAVLLYTILLRSSLDGLRNILRLPGSSANITSFFSIFIILFGFLYFIQKLGKVKHLKLFSPFLLFSLFGFISIFYSPNHWGSFEDWVRIFSYYVLAILIANTFDTRAKIVRFIKFYFGALVLPLIVGMFQFVLHKGANIGGFNRVYGTLQHPSSFVKFLNIFLLIIFVFILFKHKNRRLFGWLFLLLVFEVVVTFTRAGWLEVFISLMVVLWITKKRKWIFALFLCLCVFASLPFVRERFLSELKPISASTISVPADSVLEGSLRGRFTFNKYVIENMFMKSPVFGKGLGSFFSYYAPRVYGYQTESHGDITKVLGELGLIGTAFFITGFFVLMRFFIKNLRAIDDQFLYELVLAATALIITRFIIQAIDAELRLVLVQWYYWAFYGVAIACIYAYKDRVKG